MARVDETPTYENQASISLLVHCMKANNLDLAKRYCNLLSNTKQIEYEDLTDSYMIGFSNLTPMTYTADDLRMLGMNHRSFEAACEYSGRLDSRRKDNIFEKSERICTAIEAILDKHKVTDIYSDHEARHYLLWTLSTQASLTKTVDRDITKKAAAMAWSPLITGAAYCKISMPGISLVKGAAVIDPASNPKLQSAWDVAVAVERLLLSCSTEKSRKVLKGDMIDDDIGEDAAGWFDMSFSKAGKCFSNIGIYRMLNLWLVVTKGTMYVLDRASVDQIRSRAWSIYMFVSYCLNYRISHERRPFAKNYQTAGDAALSWYWMAVSYCRTNRLPVEGLARSMKVGQSRFLNNAWPSGEVILQNLKDHSDELRKAELEALPLQLPWSDFLHQLQNLIPDTAVLDLSYLFHISPGTDANITDLFVDSIDRLRSERSAVPSEQVRFFSYCDATLVMEWVVNQTKKHRPEKEIISAIQVEPGYGLANAQWYKRCRQCIRDLPPEAEWGKAKLVGAFHYETRMEFAWLGASDVTHVNADLEEALGLAQQNDRDSGNEILYTLRYGRLLSRKYDPTEWRSQVCQGKVRGDVFATIAAKNENTKFGHKIRETYSAVDTFRELQSEMDHNAQHAANLIQGPSLRSSQMALNAKMHSIAQDLAPSGKSKYINIVSSQDVSSWSPKMPRRFAIEFYQKVLDTTKHPKGLRYDTLWNAIGVVLNKRGVAASEMTTTGNFMGWPGTADTVLHSLICAYATNRAKQHGIMEQDETASICTMIDDAVLSLRLIRDTSNNESKVQNFMKFLMGVYANLGFEVDPVKTIVSSTKMTFLNRVFAEGCEALTPMKIYMKVNRELNLQLSNTFLSIGCIMTSGSGAAGRGADPVLTYAQCCFQAARLALMTQKQLLGSVFPDELAGLVMTAPVGLGGWGIPSLVAWLTKEARDPISEWFAQCASLVTALNAALLRTPSNENQVRRECVQRLMGIIMNAELRPLDVSVMLSQVRAVFLQGVSDVDRDAAGALLRIAVEKAHAKEVRAALTLNTSAEFSQLVEAIAQRSALDAAVWELWFESLPSVVFAPVLAKAKRNEITRMFMSYKTVHNLQRSIKKGEEANLLFLPNEFAKKQNTALPIGTLPGAHYASELRARWYKLHGVTILNHTDPAMMDLLVHVETPRNAMGFCEVIPGVILPPYNQTNKMANFYDGRIAGRANVGIKTRGKVNLDSSLLKTYNPLSRAFIRLGIACSWLAAHGTDPSPLWTLMTRAWSTSITSKWMELGLHMDADVSSKRLSSVVANTSHPISAYPNTQGYVQVNMGSLGNMLRNGHYRHDFIGLVQSIRASALIDYSLPTVKPVNRCYGANMAALIPTDTVTMSVCVPPDFDDLVDKISGVFDKGTVMGEEFVAACQTMVVSVTESVVDTEMDVHLAIHMGDELTTAASHLLGGVASNAAVMAALSDPVGATEHATTSVARSHTMGKGSCDTTMLVSRQTAEGALRDLQGDPMAIFRTVMLASSIAANIVGKYEMQFDMTTALGDKEAMGVLLTHVTPRQVTQIIQTIRKLFVRYPRKTCRTVLIRLLPYGIAECMIGASNEGLWSTVLFLLRTARNEKTTAVHYLADVIRNERMNSLAEVVTYQREKAEGAFSVGQNAKGCAAMVRSMTAMYIRSADAANKATVIAAWAQGVAAALRATADYAAPGEVDVWSVNLPSEECKSRDDYFAWGKGLMSCIPPQWRQRVMNRITRTYDENFLATSVAAGVVDKESIKVAVAKAISTRGSLTEQVAPPESLGLAESFGAIPTSRVFTVPETVQAAAMYAMKWGREELEHRRQYKKLLQSVDKSKAYIAEHGPVPVCNELYESEVEMMLMEMAPAKGTTDT